METFYSDKIRISRFFVRLKREGITHLDNYRVTDEKVTQQMEDVVYIVVVTNGIIVTC
jgi:hypothetical protein